MFHDRAAHLNAKTLTGIVAAATIYWLFNYFIVSLGVVLDSGEWRYVWQRAGAYGLSIIPTILTGIILVELFATHNRWRWPAFAICLIAASFIHGALYGLMYKYVFPIEYFGQMSFAKLTLSVTLVNFTLAGVWQLIVVSWVATRQAVANERRAARAESLAQTAQLEMLRYQLNPHFLFNTLNSISSLVVDRRNDDAEDMIMKLSAFLRRSLDMDPADLVPVRQELEAIERYLSLEQRRFSDRLSVTMEADPETMELLLPPLILQPVIENAIKHAVAPSSKPVTVTVCARCHRSDLVLEVVDDGPGLKDVTPVEGVGLGNIRMRLSLLFGSESDLVLAAAPSGGTRATITLPAIGADT